MGSFSDSRLSDPILLKSIACQINTTRTFIKRDKAGVALGDTKGKVVREVVHTLNSREVHGHVRENQFPF